MKDDDEEDNDEEEDDEDVFLDNGCRRYSHVAPCDVRTNERRASRSRLSVSSGAA
jgi:hypothetical protein